MARWSKAVICLFLLGGILAGAGLAAAEEDFQEAEKILGVKGQMQEGAWVVRFPRQDLTVALDGDSLPTALGFGSWAAFKAMGPKQVMVMGDLVLLEQEVNPVISALESAGLQVTALHNHFIRETPRIMFMHMGGMGSVGAMAQGVKNALDQTATPRAGSGAAGSPPQPLSLDTKRLEKTMGYPGKEEGGVFKITVGRPGAKMMGVELTSSLGLNSWAAFMGTEARAHVAGDIVMTAREVNPVIQALRQGGVEVVAVHNHMIEEQPRLFYLHYWGTGPADALAQTVGAAFSLVKEPVH